jgi:HK97 family phage major capsid protein
MADYQNIMQSLAARKRAEANRLYADAADCERSARGGRANDTGKFSLGRTLAELMAGGLTDGFEAESAQEAARAVGKTHDPQRPLLPWSAFKRDVSVAASGGGYLAGSVAVTDTADILRPWSTTTRAGITVLRDLVAQVVVPKATAGSTAYWTNGATAATESQPTITGLALAPKTAGAYVEVSRLLARQAPGTDAMLSGELLRTVGTAMDFPRVSRRFSPTKATARIN